MVFLTSPAVKNFIRVAIYALNFKWVAVRAPNYDNAWYEGE